MNEVHLWIRSETRADERRVPIVPDDAARLVRQGVQVTVEESPRRVFSTDDFRAVGCQIVAEGAWVRAPAGAHVLGVKELPETTDPLRHTHIYFAHAFKGQEGAEELLARFVRGGGELLDLEYLTHAGRRVVAFGHWAGYVGAALGVLRHRGELAGSVAPMTRPELDGALTRGRSQPLRALVIGANGRSGKGAAKALEVAGCQVTRWGVRDTRAVDRTALRAHDILVNCVVTYTPQAPFVTTEDLAAANRTLGVVADVTCDVTSEHNLIPLNTEVTTWLEPVRRFEGAAGPLDVIAIDNLPSLLPEEASAGFSAELLPLIEGLASRQGPWEQAQRAYRTTVAGVSVGTE